MCYFCGESFDNTVERNEHVLGHFERKHCFGCDNQLVLIGSKWYQQHMDENCIVVKMEPDYDDTEMCDKTSPATAPYNDIKMEPTEPSISTEQIQVESEPFEESDPLAEIILSQPNELDDDLLSPVDHLSGSSELPEREEQSDEPISEIYYDEQLLDGDISADKDFAEAGCSNSYVIAPHRLHQNEPFGAIKSETVEAWNELDGESESSSSRTASTSRSEPVRKAAVKLWSCSLCTRTSKLKSNMYKHIRAMHSSDDKSLATPILDSEECESSRLAQPSVRRTRTYKRFATQTSKTACNVYKHVRVRHKKDDKSPVTPVLDLEGYQASQPPVLRQADVQLWSCSLCTQTSKTACNMYKHIRARHGTGDKSLVVPILDIEEFEASRQPQPPVLRQADVQLWACSLCTQTSKTACNMYKHMRVRHKTDDKSLVTPVLDLEEFLASRPPVLRQADVKLWFCSLCSHTARNASNMFKHMRVRHDTGDRSLVVPILDVEKFEANKPMY